MKHGECFLLKDLHVCLSCISRFVKFWRTIFNFCWFATLRVYSRYTRRIVVAKTWIWIQIILIRIPSGEFYMSQPSSYPSTAEHFKKHLYREFSNKNPSQLSNLLKAATLSTLDTDTPFIFSIQAYLVTAWALQNCL